jgi:aspartate aminotransferase
LYLLEDHGVAVVPGEAFGAPGHLRLSYGCDEITLREGLNRLQKGLELLR